MYKREKEKMKTGKATGMKKKLFAMLLTIGFLLPHTAPVLSEAAEAPETTAPANVSRNGDAFQAGTYVEGEAIVCFKTGDISAVKPEEQVRQDVETALEQETCVDEAEALMSVEDVSNVADAVADGTEEAVSDDVKSGYGEGEMLPGMITLVRSDRLTTEELLAELRAREDVLYAEPNYMITPQSSDYTDLQWGEDTTYGMGVKGWNTYDGTTPTPLVDTSDQVVAIIDTGVDYTHEDLKDVMWNRGLEYPSLVAMGGGTYGINTAYSDVGGGVLDTTDPKDEHGHGTHCAGIVAAAWNGKGVSGVTSGAKIMAVKVSNIRGNYPEDAIVRGYRYVIEAKKAGVNVVATNNSYSRFMQTLTNSVLVEEAGKLGIVCVYAAGNEGVDLSVTNSTSVFTGQPGNSLVIGASDVNGDKASFSNYGPRDVDVFAPGDDIWSTVRMQTGRPTNRTAVLSVDGHSYKTDFSESETTEDPVFGFSGESDVEFSIKTVGDGKKALHVRNTSSYATYTNFKTGKLTDLKDCMGGCFEIYAEKEATFQCGAYILDEDENQIKIDSIVTTLKPGLNNVGFLYTGVTDDLPKENVRLLFEVMLNDKEDQLVTYREFDIRSFCLCSAAENYESWSGTSMATPMVTGGVAVLAAKFPEDSAAKLAARVTGSVEKREGLEGKCLSGGIFRLDKAIAGETVPVPQKASVEGKTLTVEGYFFGEAKGSISVGKADCIVASWTDEKITAELPDGFEPGENRVEVTSGKGEGHAYFRLGASAELWPRLPLPGSTLSESGEYIVTEEAKRKYPDFYLGAVKSMLVMDGVLYAFAEGLEDQTAVYRYRIEKKTWDVVLTVSGYVPTEGITTWNGKILITGIAPKKNTTAVGIFDPKANTLTWSVIEEEHNQKMVHMVNNGYGIFLIGGLNTSYDDPAEELLIEQSRQLNPVTMQATVPEDEAATYAHRSVSLCVLEDGTAVGVTGDDINPGGIKYVTVSFQGDKFKKVTDVDLEPLFKELAPNTHSCCSCVATTEGLLLFGPIIKDEEDSVVTDSYLLSYDGKKMTKLKNILSRRPTQNIATAAGNGSCYVLGMNPSEEGYYVFAEVKADTLPQYYGTKAYSNEWVDGILYGKDGFRSLTHKEKAVWKKNKTGWWYEDASGWYPKNCWQKIDGKWYYFNEKGYMEKDAYRGGYYLTSSGAWDGKSKSVGWKKDSRGWYYETGKGTYLKNGWQLINGKWYYFKADGYAAQSEWVKGYYWIGANGIWTYQPKGSWHRNKNGWWFGDTAGWYAKGKSYTIAGTVYRFGMTGYCLDE